MPFAAAQITEAIWKAAQAVGGEDQGMAQTVTKEVIETLEQTFEKSHYPTVEQVQDLVEKILIEKGHAKTAKAYILYRHKRTEKRRLQEKLIGSPTKIPLSLEGLKAFEKEFHETPEEIFQKTAHSLSNNKKEETIFYNLLANLEFLPHPHILKNANKEKLSFLFHEFIIPTNEILFEHLKNADLLLQNNCSISINLDQTDKPASLLKLFQSTSELSSKLNQKQSQHLATISPNHPSLLDVLTLKNDEKNHFEILQTEDEPNVLPKSHLKAEAYEPIALGWINLTVVAPEKISEIANKAALFLNRVFEKSTYPLSLIQEKAKNKRCSLGIMGLAEVLYTQNIDYISYEAGVFLQNIQGKISKIETNLTSNALIANLFDTTDGTEPFSKQSHLEKIAIKQGFHSPKLMTAILKAGSLKPFDKEIPENIRKLVFTAQDLNSLPRQHRPLQEKDLRKVEKWVTT